MVGRRIDRRIVVRGVGAERERITMNHNESLSEGHEAGGGMVGSWVGE